jgi:aarF domain-containing kinase
LEGKKVTGEGFKATFKRAVSILDISEIGEEELEKIRVAAMTSEGLMVSIFDILRKVPRRVLMILKLNDLTRHVLA